MNEIEHNSNDKKVYNKSLPAGEVSGTPVGGAPVGRAPDWASLAESVPISDVASMLGIPLTKRGSTLMTRCLWHEDRHPSMQVGGRRNMVYCYSCGHSDNVIGLVMEALHLKFLEACRWIESAFPGVAGYDSGQGRTQDKTIHYMDLVKSKINRTMQCSDSGDGAFFTFPEEYLKERISIHSSFAECLRQVFGESVAIRVVSDYQLGVLSPHTSVLFPSIDKEGRIRDIKVQTYDCDPRSPRFFHKIDGCTYWLGPVYLRNNPPTPNTQHPAPINRNCLFGEHLLRKRPNDTVVLVESPKNACVGYAYKPEFVWVAVGNKNMLKREVLNVLHDRRVIVFPDEDAYDEWDAKLSVMGDIACFAVMHSPGEGSKRDVADWILECPTWDMTKSLQTTL